MFSLKDLAVGPIVLLLAVAAFAQSSSQEYPTAVVTNELSGTIKARDIGDSRLTTHYYVFNGEQGDIFINLVSRNFTGDIDVFTVSGLRPLTKIVVYADQGEIETGRVIYLRKPERLLLRIQGRTPNDDVAEFRLKFGGSFLAMRPEDIAPAPELPKVNLNAGNSVNSVGTIISRPSRSQVSSGDDALPPTISKTADVPASAATTSAEVEEPPIAEKERNKGKADTKVDEGVAGSSRARSRRGTKPENVKSVKDEKVESDAVQSEARQVKEPAVPGVPEKREKDDPPVTTSRTVTKAPAVRTLAARRRPPVQPKENTPDPLESISLVVEFKNGDVLQKKMSEVAKFSVDKGVLVVSLKNGSVSRYSIVDVAKLTIE